VPLGAGNNITCFGSVGTILCLTHHPIAAGTSDHSPHNEKCTQAQPFVVDEPNSMSPHDLHRYPCQGMCP
jgi:hypothetical protein